LILLSSFDFEFLLLFRARRELSEAGARRQAGP